MGLFLVGCRRRKIWVWVSVPVPMESGRFVSETRRIVTVCLNWTHSDRRGAAMGNFLLFIWTSLFRLGEDERPIKQECETFSPGWLVPKISEMCQLVKTRLPLPETASKWNLLWNCSGVTSGTRRCPADSRDSPQSATNAGWNIRNKCRNYPRHWPTFQKFRRQKLIWKLFRVETRLRRNYFDVISWDDQYLAMSFGTTSPPPPPPSLFLPPFHPLPLSLHSLECVSFRSSNSISHLWRRKTNSPNQNCSSPSSFLSACLFVWFDCCLYYYYFLKLTNSFISPHLLSEQSINPKMMNTSTT